MTVYYTFIIEQSNDFETDVFFLSEIKVSVSDDDIGDLFHHATSVCSQLVHSDGSVHQLSQTGLQSHQVPRNLNSHTRESI